MGLWVPGAQETQTETPLVHTHVAHMGSHGRRGKQWEQFLKCESQNWLCVKVPWETPWGSNEIFGGTHEHFLGTPQGSPVGNHAATHEGHTGAPWEPPMGTHMGTHWEATWGKVIRKPGTLAG